MGRGLGVILGLVVALLASAAFAQTPPPTAPKSPFNDWSAIVVAGDWRAGNGQPTETFDNARRDVATTLMGLGFLPENLVQFSTRPERYPDTNPRRLTPMGMVEALQAGTARNRGGCLIYYISHGGPEGAVLDVQGRMSLFSPRQMGLMIDHACPGRPAIIIVSACYSGVFVPYLDGPHRMIMAAAGRERSSFGCGEGDTHPFFDECFLKSVGKVRNFPALAPVVQNCVSAKETEMGLSPPSLPQSAIGAEVRVTLSMMPFPPGAKGAGVP